ncbi:MAG: Cyclic di-GMP phosphodiesterase Gmr [Candidatus Accumulibacter appositus]|uniref:Cyclic di-GMP phosphodiesterase Gmr n=1 Tax=Candidatus Accumulibacter appositus TaxID=1454003 RepID=A0A011QKB9_9PROT|nr:response regulator [Accumulibacter sp.]EXI79324.1 MAG: Cyclic di-GMP phosphodiesterase Gmr [Candidatus Accumulibacter appositus]HRF04010.1 response regulator [Accumulibacter sp.]
MTDAANPKALILIVDDIRGNIHALIDTLRESYAVIAATNGEKALALAARKPQPDLILLDIKMPGMDGYEVLRRLKADAATADIPVIFVTALSEPAEESKGLKMGAADYVTKPIDPDLLKMRLLTQLQLRRYRGKHVLGRSSKELPELTSASILVVDDTPENVHELVSALSDEYRVTMANNGLKAIELVQGPTPPDLVLLDIRMPNMDGYEVCRRLKATEAGYRIPILFVSVLDEPIAKVQGFSLGAADYITKPFDIDETRARIRTHLQLSRLRYYFEQQVAQRTAALLAMTSQLQATLNAIPDLLFEFDLNGRYMNIHAPHPEALGAPKETLLGKLIPDVLPPKAAKVCMAALNEAHETGWSHGREYELELAQGRFWFEASVSRKEGLDSEDARFIFLSRDITDRKQAEAQLRKLSLAVEQSPESIIITNLQAEIEYVNEAFVQKTGFSRDEAIGENPRMLQSGRTPPQTYASLWGALKQGLPWKGELHNKRKDGSEFLEQCIIAPIRQADGSTSHYVAIKEDITEKRAAEERINTLAFYDSLTGLPNRRLLLDRVQQSLAADTRSPHGSALLFIDLDHFKSLNDTLGHAEGDELLKQVSARLLTCIRGCDTAARLGGDEFVVLLPDLAKDEIEAATQTRLAGERILSELRQSYSLANGQHHVTASIGVALFGGALASDSSDPVIRADQAMSQAKTAGRDTLCFFDPEVQAAADAQTALETELGQGLEAGQFLLHYQPQISLRTGEITGLEALIRWQHPDGKLVPPNDFIPAAERIRLILPVGKWVIEEACRQIRAWGEAGLPPVKVAVNVSAHQFLNGDLDVIVSQALKRHDVAPHLLDVEMTESVLMHDPVAAGIMLERIKATGVALSLDDFGTGYSSLAYLSRFPFNQLKIDRSFVQKMVTDPGAATIVRMIIDLAHRMRLNVIAEGVETEAQLGFLQKQDCDQMQGYLFSRPVPAQEISALLQASRKLPIAQREAHPKRTLLLVDDEPSILSSLRRILRNDGYHILTAESGEQALELMASHKVQVLLSDQRMPGMTGTELLRRACIITPDTVRMILSGYTDLKTVTEAVNEGFIYKFLTKPWDADELRANIREAFQHSGMSTKSTEVDTPKPAT